MYCEGNGKNEEQARREEGPELRNENKAGTGTFLRSRAFGQMSLTAPSPAKRYSWAPAFLRLQFWYLGNLTGFSLGFREQVSQIFFFKPSGEEYFMLINRHTHHSAVATRLLGSAACPPPPPVVCMGVVAVLR